MQRTFESPMDWEYQGTGPVDATSPFTQLARNPAQNIFSSPPKPSQNPFSSPSKQQNPFSNPPPLSTPSKQSSFFAPRIPGSQTAAPFRNPAFTTPRKPFDDVALSEASSPALTEPSDCPADTPELDRTSDLAMATITPSRVDKALRYNRSGPSRRHAPGRGEIPRPARDHAAVDQVRRRRRHRDARRWEDSESESDGGYGGPRGPRPPQDPGWLAAMGDNPQRAHNYFGIALKSVFATSLVFVGWKIYGAVHADITTANRAARAARLNSIAECTRQYQENQCVQNLPALRELCGKWRECMTDDPEAIFMVRNTLKEIASLFNVFSGELNVKAWGFFFAGMIILLFFNSMAAQRTENRPAPHMPYPGGPPPWAPHVGGPADYNPWMHAQTPRARRHRLEADEASGSETDDGRAGRAVFSRAIMPPQTPSRRSPRKEREMSPRKERERSPVKSGRSPAKFYN